MTTERVTVAVLLGVMFSACASVSPEESAVRGLLWDAATECARGTATITVTDVDSYGRVHYSLFQGGKQDVPQFNACYTARTAEELAKRPDLHEYLRKREREK